MTHAIMLLEVGGGATALGRLARQFEFIEGPREIAVPLADRTPEEILSTCVALNVEVRRSRVVGTGRQETGDGRWEFGGGKSP